MNSMKTMEITFQFMCNDCGKIYEEDRKVPIGAPYDPAVVNMDAADGDEQGCPNCHHYDNLYIMAITIKQPEGRDLTRCGHTITEGRNERCNFDF